jgi:hypothetical protein
MRNPPAAKFATIFEKYRIDALAKRLEGWQNFITYEVKRRYRQAGSA